MIQIILLLTIERLNTIIDTKQITSENPTQSSHICSILQFKKIIKVFLLLNKTKKKYQNNVLNKKQSIKVNIFKEKKQIHFIPMKIFSQQIYRVSCKQYANKKKFLHTYSHST